ncbi:MAG: MMPL family transporter [Treponema sp.]|jgi:predicted exporter|nr:MMPL family transporter [Treponema sp.]
MKKPFFLLNETGRRDGPVPLVLWFVFHLVFAAVLGLSVAAGWPVRVNTGLFDILPDSHSFRSVAVADKALSSRSARGVYIFAGSADFAEAKRAAASLYDRFAGTGVFESLSFYVDESLLSEFTSYLTDYRYVLLDGEARELLEKGGAEELATDALAAAYGAFTFTSLDALDRDPFFLADRGIRRFLDSGLLSGSAMSPKEDVLAARYEGLWYVMIRGTLPPSGVAVTNAGSGVERIYAACGEISAGEGGARFVFSGVPFHSYESSSGAQREISFISTVTLIIIAFIFLGVFRSALPVLVSVSAVLVSLLTAATAVLLFFREIHILTFVFGTTLIGIGVDYSIHYFMNWRGNPLLPGGPAIRAHIFRGITMSFISSEICFAALFFAPFVILKQFAVFLFTGLLSSWLTAMVVYPRFALPLPEKRRLPALHRRRDKSAGLSPPLGRSLKRAVLAVMAIVPAIIIVINRDMIRVENNIAGLYTMSPALRESERIASRILDHGSAGWYFIVSGDSAGEVLEHEEALRVRLDEETGRGNLRSYMAASLFVPSPAAQERNYQAAKALLPLADSQFALLGFPPEAARAFREDFAAREGNFVLPGEGLPPNLRDILSNLWIGEVEGRWYSCVLPLHAKNEQIFRSLAEESDSVYFVNKVRDIGTELDALTRIMLILFAVAYVIVGVIVNIFYPRREALGICAVPCLLTLVTLAVLSCAGIPLSFFPVVGLVLVFGLGLDYIFYVSESRRTADSPLRRTTTPAIVLSFATTALSFGALSLSGFTPVHLFGLTVFSGLTAAFAASLLMSVRPGDSG